jgi:hypothetical protein
MSTNNKVNTKAAPQISVAEFLTGAIGLSGKTQREITTDIGYDNPNILTLFKQGKTKLPVNKVKLLAQSLGVDPTRLLRIVMTEYMPDAWQVISDLAGDSIVSPDERALLGLAATSTGGLGIDLHDAKLVEDLKAAFEAHAARAKKELAAGAGVTQKAGRHKAA